MLTNKEYKIIDWLTKHGFTVKRAQDIRHVQKFEDGQWNKKTEIEGKINTIYEVRSPNGQGSKEIGEFELKEFLNAEAIKHHLK